MPEERKPSLAGDFAPAIFLIVVGFGAFLFFGWAVVIGPWAFDDFMVDILPWRHEYITSMKTTHLIGHYILFGFLALLGIFGGYAGIKALVDTIKRGVKSRRGIQRVLN